MINTTRITPYAKANKTISYVITFYQYIYIYILYMATNVRIDNNISNKGLASTFLDYK